MPHHTSIESDGQTVYIHSGMALDGQTGAALRYATLGLTVLLFGWVLWELSHERSGLLLCFLLIRFAVYPVLRRMARGLVREDVQLDTQRLTAQRTYGFIRGRKYTATYHEGQLATGAEALDKKGTQMQVAWYTDAPDGKKPQLLYRHFFSMTSTDYETVKAYVQELFDLDASEDFELLFSAN